MSIVNCPLFIMVIYADVLIILNLYINYFLIRSTALFLRRKLSAKRCVFAALIGGLGALVILLPELPFFVVAAEKAALGALIIFAAFGKQRPADFAVSTLFFLAVSFAFAGVMMALWTFAAPYSMVFSNGVCSFDIPLIAIAAFTAGAYCLVRLIRLLSDRRIRCVEIRTVKIRRKENEVSLRGLSDTGNSLCDIFTGKPVIICAADKLANVAPQCVCDYLNGITADNIDGIRLIPCKTVTSEALMPVFRADSVTIDGKNADAVIGVSKNPLGEDVDCIFDPKIISL